MPADKIKFKQIAKELQNDRIDAALTIISNRLKQEELNAAEVDFGQLIRDLKYLILVKAVADK